MRFNSKLTWGLAWAGLAIVLVVPSADYLTGVLGKGKTTALLTSTSDPVKPLPVPAKVKPAAANVTKSGSVTTKVTKNGVSIVPNTVAPAASTQVASNTAGAPVLDPVDKLVQSGKKLPDYISDGDTTTTGSIPAVPSPGATKPSGDATQVATIDPATAAAPVPFPRRPPDVAHAALPKPTQARQPTVIVDEQQLATQEATAMPDQLQVGDDAGPVPPAGLPDDWRTVRQRKLMKYLEQNGLVDGASADGRSSASVTIIQKPSPDYDPDGFYLSDGPNGSKAARRARIERMLEEQNDDEGFTLF